MIVRRLRSIRLSSIRSTVRLKPPIGGTRRVVGSMVVVAWWSIGGPSESSVVAWSPVRVRKASSMPREAISRSRASVSVSR